MINLNLKFNKIFLLLFINLFINTHSKPKNIVNNNSHTNFTKFSAENYCENYPKNSFIIIIFPKKETDIFEIEEILKSNGLIICSKELELSIDNKLLFLENLYKYNPSNSQAYSLMLGPSKWFTSFKNFNNKNTNFIKAYLFNSKSLTKVLSLKNNIIKKFDSNHIIYTTDIPKETLNIAKLIFDINIYKNKNTKSINLGCSSCNSSNN